MYIRMYRLLPHQTLVANSCHSIRSLVEVLTLFTRFVIQHDLGLSKRNLTKSRSNKNPAIRFRKCRVFGILTPLIALLLTFGLTRTYTGLLERSDGIALATLILAFTSGLPHAVNAFLARRIKHAKGREALCLLSVVVFVLQVLALYGENDTIVCYYNLTNLKVLLSIQLDLKNSSRRALFRAWYRSL